MKTKDIKKMSKEEKDKKLKELRVELIKSRIDTSKSGSSKIKNIKRSIAKILTFNK